MKTDLATSIIAAIVGIVGGYLVCNFIVPAVTTVSFETISSAESDFALEEPNPEVFNYRALNPTVEVYVGQCEAYNSDGECVQNFAEESNSESANGAN